MKVLAYLAAGVSLMALGALGAAFCSHSTTHVTVPNDRPVSVGNVEFIPDSGPGWAVEKPEAGVESRVHILEMPEERMRMGENFPYAREAVYYNTQVGAGRTTWTDLLAASAGLIIFMAMLLIAALVALRLKLKSEQNGTPAEGGDIQALQRQAQSLADRMESLETLLLDRGRPGR